MKLKHIIYFIFIVLMFFYTESKAQSTLRMGFRAGMNFAQISGYGMQGFTKFGALGGVGLHWRFSPRFSFDPELIYSMKGARKNPNVNAGDYSTFTSESDYLEVPMLFSWHFDKRDRFTMEFGPSLGVLVRERAEQNSGELVYSRGFNRVDLGLVLGFSYHLTKNWAFHARFQNSIIPIKPFDNNQTFVMPLWGIIKVGEVHSLFHIGIQYNLGFNEPKENKKIKLKPQKKTQLKKPKKQRGDVIDEE